MKLEKLTENKIRVVINSGDLQNENVTLQDFISNATEFQKFFVELLERAKKELNFNTKNCKLFIESFSSPDGVFIFTITKTSAIKDINKILSSDKRLISVNRKLNVPNINCNIYAFDNFEEFCSFCTALHSSNILKNKIAKNISLYLYNDTYYLLVSQINTKNTDLKHFYSYISEFSKQLTYSKSFEGKLLEHGKLIIKNNAISTGIKFFVK